MAVWGRAWTIKSACDNKTVSPEDRLLPDFGAVLGMIGETRLLSSSQCHSTPEDGWTDRAIIFQYHSSQE